MKRSSETVGRHVVVRRFQKDASKTKCSNKQLTCSSALFIWRPQGGSGESREHSRKLLLPEDGETLPVTTSCCSGGDIQLTNGLSAGRDRASCHVLLWLVAELARRLCPPAPLCPEEVTGCYLCSQDEGDKSPPRTAP